MYNNNTLPFGNPSTRAYPRQHQGQGSVGFDNFGYPYSPPPPPPYTPPGQVYNNSGQYYPLAYPYYAAPGQNPSMGYYPSHQPMQGPPPPYQNPVATMPCYCSQMKKSSNSPFYHHPSCPYGPQTTTIYRSGHPTQKIIHYPSTGMTTTVTTIRGGPVDANGKPKKDKKLMKYGVPAAAAGLGMAVGSILF